MSIIAVGVNHKTAPVEIREKMSFTESSLQESLAMLMNSAFISGCVIVSTCNRTEIYTHAADAEQGIMAIRELLRQKSGVETLLIKKFTYTHIQHQAVHHLFRVTAGLDSMILGETQILGQVRDAYLTAQKYQATDKVINNLFKHAIAVGKKARTDTGIDQLAVSISYAAVEMAKQLFGSLYGRSVLVVGAGKMSELTAKHLVANGISGVIVSNRSYDRAASLAQQFNGQAVKFDELYSHIGSADIVISCTAASHYVVRSEGVHKVMEQNPDKKIMMIDIAVPRDIEPRVGEINGVSLYDIDALQNVVDSNLAERKRAAVLAEAIIEDKVGEFIHWLGSQYVVPTVAALKKLGDEIKKKELVRALNRLGNLPEHDQKIIKSLANSIINQLLHAPVSKLKEYALTEKGPIYNETIEKLFDLEVADEKPVEKNETPNMPAPAQALGRR